MTQKVGVIGGLPIAPVKRFINGFANGVTKACSGCTTTIIYCPFGGVAEATTGLSCPREVAEAADHGVENFAGRPRADVADEEAGDSGFQELEDGGVGCGHVTRNQGGCGQMVRGGRGSHPQAETHVKLRGQDLGNDGAVRGEKGQEVQGLAGHVLGESLPSLSDTKTLRPLHQCTQNPVLDKYIANILVFKQLL